jgi:hypothetical protein
MKRDWTPMSDISVKRFISKYEDEVIYIIQTGFQDNWMVVFEDAHETSVGHILLGTKEEIEQKFKIEL